MTEQGERKISKEEAERIWDQLEARPGFNERLRQALDSREEGITASEYLRQRAEREYLQGIGDSGEDAELKDNLSFSEREEPQVES